MIVCPVCKHLFRGDVPPDEKCPKCGAHVSDASHDALTNAVTHGYAAQATRELRTCSACKHTETEEDYAISPAACSKCGKLFPAIRHKQSKEPAPPRQPLILQWLKAYKRLVLVVTGSIAAVALAGGLLFYAVLPHIDALLSEMQRIFVSEVRKYPDPGNGSSSTVIPKPKINEGPTNIVTASPVTYLTFTSRRNLTIWFINDKTQEHDGPYPAGQKPTTVVMDQGSYTVQLIENGKLKNTLPLQLDQKTVQTEF